MDATEFNKAPKQNHFPEASMFFIIYLLLGGLFVMNLFIGFVVDGFNANKGATDTEIIYGRFRRQLKSTAPFYDTFLPPQNFVSSTMRAIVMNRFFQLFSTCCLITNLGFMLSDYADSAGTEYAKMQDLQNYIFFWELVAEVAMGIIAFGIGGLYNDLWRLFDLVVCLATSLGYISQSESLSSFARVFRLARVIRLAIRFKQIKVIIETLMTTLPQLGNVIILIALIYSMCAVLGVQLFATTKNGFRLGPTANFQNFPSGIKTIWQIVTGDEWMILLADCGVQAPYCTMEVPGKAWNDCGSYAVSFIFYVFVKIVCEFIMLNLFIGLILDNFSYITEDVGHEEDEVWTEGPSIRQLQYLCKVFKEYDCKSGFIPITSLHCILCDLPVPIGYR